jgi:hypothetical protein
MAIKTLTNALISVAVLAVPVLSFAQQPSAPVTRAQVRAELIQLDAAGFKGAPIGPHFPANLQAAEARVATQNGVAQAPARTYGPSTDGSSQSGQHAVSTNAQ